MIKILSLNLWRYYGNWEKRKINIIKYIKKQKPDVVFFQECFDDGRYNNSNENQAKQLNNLLGFENYVYSIAEMLRTEQNTILTTSVFDGLGCLSKFPIVSVQTLRLKQHETDKHFRIIQKITLNVKRKIIFYHTHFSNRDNLARLHLKETINLAISEKTLPIIVGDLNIKLIKDIIDIASKNYKISWVEKNYCSYPSKNEVLDYILIPKNINFIEITCNKEGLSDHYPLLTIIEENL
jgi:endonuclease/exonuclease/phosphatase family metal-dependent hydrolase